MMANERKTMPGLRPKTTTDAELSRLGNTYLDQNIRKMSEAERLSKTPEWDLHTLEGEVLEEFGRAIKKKTRSQAVDIHLANWQRKNVPDKAARDKRVLRRSHRTKAAPVGNGGNSGGGSSGSADGVVPQDPEHKDAETATQGGSDGSSNDVRDKATTAKKSKRIKTRRSGGGEEANTGRDKARPTEYKDDGGGYGDGGDDRAVTEKSDEEPPTAGGSKASLSEDCGCEGDWSGRSSNIFMPAPPANGGAIQMRSVGGSGGGGGGGDDVPSSNSQLENGGIGDATSGGSNNNEVDILDTPVTGELFDLGDFAEFLWDPAKDDEWYKVKITRSEKRTDDRLVQLTFIDEKKKKKKKSKKGTAPVWATDMVSLRELIENEHILLPGSYLTWPDLFD